MTLTAPFAATIEWCVEVGASVKAHDVLAWLSVPDHCALRPLIAPSGGTVSWRRSALLLEAQAGEALALLEDDPVALEGCLASERTAALDHLGRLETELEGLRRAHPSPLRAALIAPTLESLHGRIEALRSRWPVDRLP